MDGFGGKGRVLGGDAGEPRVGVLGRELVAVAGDGEPRAVDLQAAATSAAAGRAVFVEDDVPYLSRPSRHTPIQGAVDDDAAADAAADGDEEHVAGAATGAESVLGDGGGVGVVLQEARDVELLLEPRGEGDIAPAREVGGMGDHAAQVVDRPGRGDADRRQLLLAEARLAQALAQGGGHAGDDGVGPFGAKGGTDVLGEDGAGGVDDEGEDLGGAEVEAAEEAGGVVAGDHV